MTDFQAEANRLSADNDDAPVIIVSAHRSGGAYWSSGMSYAEAAAILLSAATAVSEAAVRGMGLKGRVQ